MAKLLATLFVVVGVVAVAAVVLMGSDDDEGSSMTAVPAEAQDAYFVGPNFGDLPLTEVLVPPHGAGDSTSFIYGDCEPAGDAGCAPPLEIQTWSICARFPRAPARGELVNVRGAKAEVDPAEGRVEIYTGSKAAVVFSDPRLAERVLEELRPARTEQASSNLPPSNTRAC